MFGALFDVPMLVQGDGIIQLEQMIALHVDRLVCNTGRVRMSMYVGKLVYACRYVGMYIHARASFMCGLERCAREKRGCVGVTKTGFVGLLSVLSYPFLACCLHHSQSIPQNVLCIAQCKVTSVHQ